MKRYLLVESGVSNVPSGTPDSIDFDYQKESNDLLYIIKYYKHTKKNQDLFQKKMKQYKITNGENLEKLMLSSFFGGESALMGIPIGASIYAAIKAANKLINGIGNPAANLGIAIVGSVLVYVFRINALTKVDDYYTRELQTTAPTYEELWRHQK